MKKHDYYLLIHKSLTGEITEQENETLSSWLNYNPNNQQLFDELRLTLEAVSETDDFKPLGKGHIQQQSELLNKNLADAKKREVARYRSALLYRNVAILALLIVTFTFIIAYVVQHRLARPIAMTVDKNQTLILGDSSMVSLNKNSRLSFSQSWRVRNVEFQGEAFFQVAKDKTKPFIIQLPDGLIKVLGTSFFVKAYPNDTSEVWVSSGSVEVSSKDKRALLRSGQKASFTNGVIVVEAADVDPNFTSWYTRKLQFDKTKLRKIISLLEDEYHIAFKVSNPELLSCRFTGTFDNEALDTVLRVLSSSMGFSFRLQDGVYFIEGTGCRN